MSGSPSRGRTLRFSTEKIAGNGSFGVVYKAKILESGEECAIKKVLQDKRFKNRELQIMKTLSHTNIVKLKHCFYTSGEDRDEIYLNLVLEYVPETVYQVSRSYYRAKRALPMLYVKLYMYQMCRALAYIHSLGVCHRDIKPQNLLVNSRTHVLKLCDFGSAKILVAGQPNVSYICSRYYRAPELIFGATLYTTAIDIWSAGCMLGELMRGKPMFPGDSGVDQLVMIIRIMGTPTDKQMDDMNPSYTEMPFPQVEPQPWSQVFRNHPHVTPDACDLLSKMLDYTPTSRVTALDALAHPFFDELREPGKTLPRGGDLPPLFDFAPSELAANPSLAPVLIPKHARNAENWPPGMYDSVSGAASASSESVAPSGASSPSGRMSPSSGSGLGSAGSPSGAAAAAAAAADAAAVVDTPAASSGAGAGSAT